MTDCWCCKPALDLHKMQSEVRCWETHLRTQMWSRCKSPGAVGSSVFFASNRMDFSWGNADHWGFLIVIPEGMIEWKLLFIQRPLTQPRWLKTLVLMRKISQLCNRLLMLLKLSLQFFVQNFLKIWSKFYCKHVLKQIFFWNSVSKQTFLFLKRNF